MNPIDALMPDPFGQALGWTLLHFVWQGALVALLLALALYGLRRQTAQVRYVVACGAMVLLLVLPVLTLFLLLPEPVATPMEQRASAVEPAVAAALDAGAATLDAPTPQQGLASMLAAALPWLVLLWMAGVLTLSVRYLAGWIYTIRLRRRGAREVGQRWQDHLVRLKQQMGVRRAVRLVSSALVQVPTVAGWLRPVILLPVSVFTGLSPRQIEMVIAHELAHIRRHDYLINLLQAACETVLFYHPAVWWVSQRIRLEREHCCDDRVVAVCGDAYTYAAALAKLETARQTTPRLALAANGGSLLGRVRRLLEEPAEAPQGAARWFAGLTVLVVLGMSLLLSSTLGGLWDRLQESASSPAILQEQARSQHQRSAVGFEKTALLLQQLIFEDRSGAVQLEALDELRVLPQRVSLPGLIDIAERHPRQRVRHEAVQWLGRLGDAYVVLTLEHVAFEDDNASVQMEALDALRNLPDKIGWPSLIKIARTHPRAEMRSEAVQAFGRLGDEAARTTLNDILYTDPDAGVQRETFDALMSLPAGIASRKLEQLAETHPNEDIRREAADELKQRQARSLRNGALRTRDVVRPPASWGTHQSTAERLEALIFSDESETTQQEALQALADLQGEAPLPSLKKIAGTHPNQQVREQAARHVAEVAARVAAAQQEHARWSQALDDLNHEDVSRRISAVKTLEDLPTRNAFSDLSDVVFHDASLDVQRQALDALRDKGGTNLGAMALLARIIRTHPNPAIRTEALHSMKAMNLNDQLDVLEEVIFRDESPAVRQEALTVLKGLPDEVRIPVLQKIAHTHRDAPIRQRATQILETVDTEDVATFSDRMFSALDVVKNHPEARRRAEAVQTLREWSSVTVITILADLAYDDPSLEVQLEALDALRDRGDWDGTSWVVHFARNHPNPAMRVEAVQSLDAMKAQDRLPLLEEVIFRDDNLAVRTEALDRLIDAPEAEATSLLAKIALQQRLPASLRQAAAEALDER